MAILVTGGAGYIGSHTIVCLQQAGYEVIVLDNLLNGSGVALQTIKQITGKELTFIGGDIRDKDTVEKIFSAYPIESVIHFAGLKAVGESSQIPLDYYDVNVNGTLTLLKAMNKANVKHLVFSSSATVYGQEAPIPYQETAPRGTPTNPYGATKAMIETMLEDLANSDKEWKITALRYFNPIGAHESGLIGEAPKGIPNNLMPFITQVAVGKRNKLQVFGDDYPTQDGTCRRDYIHVMDLAEGHVAALNHLAKGFNAVNLGTGTPISVLELVKAFEQTTNIPIPYEIVERRKGDLAEFWADASLAKTKLNWEAKRSIEQMVADSWNWQRLNPSGY